MVGIIDYMFGTPDLEPTLSGKDVEIDYFATTDERSFHLSALPDWTRSVSRAHGPGLAASAILRAAGVVRSGVSYENIDLPALSAAGIPFADNPD